MDRRELLSAFREGYPVAETGILRYFAGHEPEAFQLLYLLLSVGQIAYRFFQPGKVGGAFSEEREQNAYAVPVQPGVFGIVLHMCSIKWMLLLSIFMQK